MTWRSSKDEKYYTKYKEAKRAKSDWEKYVETHPEDSPYQKALKKASKKTKKIT